MKRSTFHQVIGALITGGQNKLAKKMVEASSTSKINNAAIDAEFAFWAEVAKKFPEIKTGDMEPMQAAKFSIACKEAVKQWVKANE